MAFSLPIIAFGRWVRRLRRNAKALLRDGDLVEMKVLWARRGHARGASLTSARGVLPGGAKPAFSVSGHPEAQHEGAVNPGLVLDGTRVGLVVVDGSAVPAKLG